MKIENLNDLKKLLRLCRKEGVTEIVLGEVSFKLGDLPVKAYTAPEATESNQEIPLDGALSEEELAFWSATPPIQQDS